MIPALLFLILFGLLFPKALRFLFALLFIGGIMVLGEVHAKPLSWVSYWYSLDEQCRGGAGDDVETTKACDKRSDVDKILTAQGCVFRYPNGWPELKGEYWKCSKSSRMNFEYYSPGQMYSGPLGAHIGAGPHVMAPYTGW